MIPWVQNIEMRLSSLQFRSEDALGACGALSPSARAIEPVELHHGRARERAEAIGSALLDLRANRCFGCQMRKSATSRADTGFNPP